ncbi:hypothetical protein DAPPUDRAFT_121000 [Daphnia pulex]|uniref:Uncharacterized protein n=1 Tax=Daphnia pulex TaxID=6669 RepID=E9I2K7_DAPPU|nr:hypothetical protein DAPPUDRAFT_121000 [Daphnia pulex]|eukprot:EFX61775.1 hypothetical protein DAPPUDRAFT_121000 [Daphnia pulex]
MVVTRKNKHTIQQMYDAGVRGFQFAAFKVPCPSWLFAAIAHVCTLQVRSLIVSVWRNNYADIYNRHHDAKILEVIGSHTLENHLESLTLEVMSISHQHIDLAHMKRLRRVHVVGWDVTVAVPPHISHVSNRSGMVEGSACFQHYAAKAPPEIAARVLMCPTLVTATIGIKGIGHVCATAGNALHRLRIDTVSRISCDITLTAPLDEFRLNAYEGSVIMRGSNIRRVVFDGSSSESNGVEASFPGLFVNQLVCVADDICRLRRLDVDVVIVNAYTDNLVLRIPPSVNIRKRLLVRMHFEGTVVVQQEAPGHADQMHPMEPTPTLLRKYRRKRRASGGVKRKNRHRRRRSTRRLVSGAVPPSPDCGCSSPTQ